MCSIFDGHNYWFVDGQEQPGMKQNIKTTSQHCNDPWEVGMLGVRWAPSLDLTIVVAFKEICCESFGHTKFFIFVHCRMTYVMVRYLVWYQGP